MSNITRHFSMDINEVPKKLCENISIAYTKEFFVMVLLAGSETNVYALTPQHAKRLAQYLSHRVDEFEQSHGTIDAQWQPDFESPIQISELHDASGGGKNSRDEGGDNA